MKKSLIYGAALAAILVSCEEKNEKEPDVTGINSVKAIKEVPADLLEIIPEDKGILFSEGDAIYVWADLSKNSKATKKDARKLTTKEVGKQVVFTTERDEKLEDVAMYHALYPYTDADQKISPKDTAITFVFPAEQNYVADGIDPTVAFAYGEGPKDKLHFYNQYGILHLPLRGEETIGKIKVSYWTEEEKLVPCAYTIVACTDDEFVELTEFPVIVEDEFTETAITLNCGKGVALSETENTDFNIVLLPTAKKLTIEFIGTDGTPIDTISTEDAVIKRSEITVMPTVILDSVGAYVLEDIFSFESPLTWLLKDSEVFSIITDEATEGKNYLQFQESAELMEASELVCAKTIKGVFKANTEYKILAKMKATTKPDVLTLVVAGKDDTEAEATFDLSKVTNGSKDWQEIQTTVTLNEFAGAAKLKLIVESHLTDNVNFTLDDIIIEEVKTVE